MDLVVTSVRRLLWMVLLSAVGGATYAYWRDRKQVDDLAPAEWPPLDTPATPTTSTAATEATSTSAPAVSDPVEATADPSTADDDGGSTGPSADDLWVAPLDDGSCPVGYPIKANDKSGIFHVPEGRFYERTKAERCYASADDATSDGYRRSKS